MKSYWRTRAALSEMGDDLWEGFRDYWCRTWPDFLQGYVSGFGMGMLLLAVMFTAFSLLHRDHSMAVYCASLALVWWIGFCFGRRR